MQAVGHSHLLVGSLVSVEKAFSFSYNTVNFAANNLAVFYKQVFQLHLFLHRGGRHVGIALCAMTAELGCLNVSRFVSFPHAAKVFDEEGVAVNAEETDRRLNAMLVQLDWMG
jgi:hypothetical protein